MWKPWPDRWTVNRIRRLCPRAGTWRQLYYATRTCSAPELSWRQELQERRRTGKGKGLIISLQNWFDCSLPTSMFPSLVSSLPVFLCFWVSPSVAALLVSSTAIAPSATSRVFPNKFGAIFKLQMRYKWRWFHHFRVSSVVLVKGIRDFLRT